VPRALPPDASAAFAALAARVGRAGAGDAADEHWRWEVYSAAIEEPRTWEALWEAVRVEPELGTVVVPPMLERVPTTEHAHWLAALPEEQRDFAAARASDVATLRALVGEDASAAARDVDAWSDWLQRRLASDTGSASVLAVLEAHARTRRVRGLARERLAGKLTAM
jgi:hypothetical protein